MMNRELVSGPGSAAKALAVLSVAGFWALPFAPVVAIGAVRSTEETAGWSRRRPSRVPCCASRTRQP
jgi:hypothetical protein